jgi:hypothetical protein
MKQRVVSLGGNCMVTKEMRVFYGVESANMFDWWITPGDALVRLIEADFDDLFAPGNLRIVGEGRSVANLRYGILHHHDFPRNDAADRVMGISELDLQRNRDKFTYLKKRWDDLGDNPDPVLFVRYAWHMFEPLLTGIPPEPLGADAARLVAALDRKFPQLDFRILLIDGWDAVAPGAMAAEIAMKQEKVLYRETPVFTQPGEYLKAADLAWRDNTAVFTRLFSTVQLR